MCSPSLSFLTGSHGHVGFVLCALVARFPTREQSETSLNLCKRYHAVYIITPCSVHSLVYLRCFPRKDEEGPCNYFLGGPSTRTATDIQTSLARCHSPGPRAAASDSPASTPGRLESDAWVSRNIDKYILVFPQCKNLLDDNNFTSIAGFKTS